MCLFKSRWQLFFFFGQAVYTHYCLKTLVIDNSGCVDQRDLPVRFHSKLIPSSYSIPECNELYHTYDVIGCSCVINQCRWIPKWCKLWIYCTLTHWESSSLSLQAVSVNPFELVQQQLGSASVTPSTGGCCGDQQSCCQ